MCFKLELHYTFFIGHLEIAVSGSDNSVYPHSHSIFLDCGGIDRTIALESAIFDISWHFLDGGFLTSPLHKFYDLFKMNGD